mmetsp:Transcript_48361/g.115217  ORF Transcript_48361/g.115217 Transcript_48361/m.115217 type:complete len:212 (-) Transcript_48361:260-895(-)
MRSVSVSGSKPQPPPPGEPSSSVSSSQSASASSSHGDICPPFVTGEATPELATEASAEAAPLAPGKPGVSRPKPGVPRLCAWAALPPSPRVSFILAPCSAMESRCSSRRSARSKAARPGLPPSRECTVVPMPSWPPARQAAAPARREGDSAADSAGDSPLGGARGVGCGDSGTGFGGGLLGKRLCCISLIVSSRLMRQALRPQRAHVRSSN